MSSFRSLHEGLTDDSLRLAILVGLASVPFTLALSWESLTFSWESVSAPGVTVGGTVSGVPLLLAGVIVGYCYSHRPTDSRRAGIWTGLAGSIATVFVFVAPAATTIPGASSEMAVVTVVLIPIAIVIGVGLTVLITMVTAVIADRVTTRLRNRPVSDPGENASPSRWWQAVPVYVLLVPVVLLSVVWVALRPDSGIAIAVSALGVIAVTALSIATLTGLFLDATASHGGWIPRVWFYIGGPFALAVLVYVAATVRGMTDPSAPGMYGFIVALWLASVVYTTNKRRYTGTLGIT